MRAKIDAQISAGKLPACCRTLGGTVSDLPGDLIFDTLIYIDVLEHIEDDRAELVSATNHLAPNGTLILLAPAYNFLFSPFDHSIGHYRRYNKDMLIDITPYDLHIEKLFYLDSVGILMSLTNRFFLKQSMPQLQQILFWDHRVLPLSRILDKLTGYSVGRSIVGIWRKITK